MKKSLLIVGALAIVLATVPMFAAWEAHVINVTAHIENALRVHKTALDFGTVFPQEWALENFDMSLSDSFQDQNRATDVTYVIKQKPKCECDRWSKLNSPSENEELCPDGQYQAVGYATHTCPDGYTEMPDLCKFLSKEDGDPNDNNDTEHPSYFVPAGAEPAHCINQPERFYGKVLVYSSTGWGGHSCPQGMKIVDGGVTGATESYVDGPAKPGTSVDGVAYPVYPHYTYNSPEEGWVVHNGAVGQSMQIWVDCITPVPDATGVLSLDNDLSDNWIIDLKVPPIDGTVGQEWPAGCPVVAEDSVDYGCDLWIEVTDISPSVTPTE